MPRAWLLWLVAAAACADVLPRSCRELHADGAAFKILQVSDLEYTNGADTPCLNASCRETQTLVFVRRLLDEERPDLTVVSGDTVIAGARNPRSALQEVLQPLCDYGKPWLLQFGNHDEQSGLSRREMLQVAHDMCPLCCCSVNGPAHLPGVGNVNLTVFERGRPIAAVIAFDSGNGYNDVGGYDWIQTSQVAWFAQTARDVQLLHDAQSPVRFGVPLLLFFHIPLPEFASLLESTEDEMLLTGSYQEKVWHSGVNGGLFAAAVENGNVHGMFVGHDHLNDFCHRHVRSGIYLCYAGSAGYGAYGKDGWARRARLVRAFANGTVDTWKRLDDADLTLVDAELLVHAPGPLPEHMRPRSAWRRTYVEPKVVIIVTVAAAFAAGVAVARVRVSRWLCWRRAKTPPSKEKV